MNIRTLRSKLESKKITWVQSGTADYDSRFKPDTEDGKNHTLVYVPKVGMLHIDNGEDDVIMVKMTEKQYRNLFNKYGYVKNETV